MKNRSLLIVSLICLTFGLFSSALYAQSFQLTFEGLQDLEEVREFYNGGTGSMGSSGPNYGVSFTNTALAIIDSDATGGTGNFANEPSPDTIVFWTAGASVVMNVAAGFQTGFSFYYSSSVPTTVTVYDGLGATGNILATINLTAQFATNCTGDPNGAFCNWSADGASFAGTARSVDFSGGANQTAYDNITFGSSNPVFPPSGAGAAPIPTLSEWAMILLVVLMGLIGTNAVMRRQQGI